MKTINKIQSSIWACTLLLGSFLLPGFASAAQGSLIGVNINGFPNVDYAQVLGATGQECKYDAATDTLSIKAEATFTFFGDPGPLGFIIGGLVDLQATIDGAGVLSGGTFTLSGSVSDGSTTYGDPLLTGTVSDYGIVDTALGPNTTDQADFRIAPTGGSLLPLMGANDVAVLTSLELSDYAGTMASNWSADRCKGQIGPTPPDNQPTCDMTLTKTVDPAVIGPIVPPGNDEDSDSDSDSGQDHNGNNDTDDSDADSGDDSVDNDPPPPACGCKGKVDELTLQYNGLVSADVSVTDKKGNVIFGPVTVAPGGQFTLIGMDKHGTLGPKIFVAIDGGDVVEIHTSCSEPIGPGLIAGDFEVISGGSRKLTVPLCPIVDPACPPGQEVTYTYTVTNNGSAVTNLTVTDDKLGIVGQAASLAGGGASLIFTETACIFETTTNLATATGVLSNLENCDSNEATATVEVLPPPDPCGSGVDSDSDSGMDNNNNGNSDDSDSDSGDCDLDGDSDVAPVTLEGCTPGYWKQNQHLDSWVGYVPGDKFEEIFDVDAAGNKDLLMSLKAKGGKSKALGRHAVAALLNAANPNVDFFFSVADVISIVQDAYTTFDFKSAKNLLEEANKDGCPLN